DRRALLEAGKLGGDVCEAAGLRGNSESSYQAIERTQNRGDAGNRIGGRVYADDRIAATIEQAVKGRQQNAADVVGRMIGLQANAQHPAVAKSVAAASDVADF